MIKSHKEALRILDLEIQVWANWVFGFGPQQLEQLADTPNQGTHLHTHTHTPDEEILGVDFQQTLFLLLRWSVPPPRAPAGRRRPARPGRLTALLLAPMKPGFTALTLILRSGDHTAAPAS